MRLLPCMLGLLAASACGFRGSPGGNDGPIVDGSDGPLPTDGPPIDMTILPDVPSDPNCFGSTSLTYVCLQSLPTMDLTFDAGDNHGDGVGSLDTTNGAEPLCSQLKTGGAMNICVIAGRSITIDRFVGTYGTRPIVFLATEGTINITSNGTIDASSGQAGDPGENGPGTAVGGCGAPGEPGASGGGAGGSLGGTGGTGGASGGGNGGGGGAGTVTLATAYRGGCPGGIGKGPGGGNNALGGLGGGSVTLISAVEIVVSGAVNASGGGGEASAIDGNGGGGGGSGGVIVLDTPSLTVTGTVIADGGGGAGGSGAVVSDGTQGETPTPTMRPAMGGPGGGTGGNGGTGSSGGDGSPGSAGTATGGGGGGGGGAGIIKTLDPSPPTGGTVTPPFS